MKILETLLTETKNEAEETVKRKGELHNEAKVYMEYLDQQVQREKEAEIELERLVNMEVEKQWDKRVQQWQLERAARRAMTEEMVVVRTQQISDKLRLAEEEKQTYLEEREELAAAFAEHEALEAEKMKRLKQKNLTYQDNLSSQVAHGSKIRQAEQAEKQRELHIQNLAEEQYQTKFGESLQRPDVDRAHPLRSYNKRSNPLFN